MTLHTHLHTPICVQDTCTRNATNFLPIDRETLALGYGPTYAKARVCEKHFVAYCEMVLDREVDLPAVVAAQYLCVGLPA